MAEDDNTRPLWKPESFHVLVQKSVSLTANLRREIVSRVGVNGDQAIIRAKDFFVNNFGGVNAIPHSRNFKVRIAQRRIDEQRARRQRNQNVQEVEWNARRVFAVLFR